jgi:HEAT repeat protein
VTEGQAVGAPRESECSQGAPAVSVRKRSKRIYVYWGIALTLLLGLGVFCWLVVLPVSRAGKALERLNETRVSHYRWPAWAPGEPESQVEKLGGPASASRQLHVYIMMPQFAAPDKHGAVVLLGYCGAPAAYRLVALLHEDDTTRGYAVSSLERIGKPAVPALIGALEDEDSSVRYWVAFLLDQAKDDRAIVPLLRALGDDDEGVRRNVGDALGNFGARVAPRLRQMLADPDWRVRAGAAWALRNVRDADDAPTFASLLNDECWQVRWNAACVLADFRYAPAADALLARLSDGKEHDKVRGVSGWALARMGDRRALRPLMRMLKHSDWSLRRLAAEALGDLRDPAALKALEEFSGAKNNPYVDQTITEAIKKIKAAQEQKR